MSAIRPNNDQFVALATAPDDAPVVMLNLLKFKPRPTAGASRAQRARPSTRSTVTPRSRWSRRAAARRCGSVGPTKC